MHATSVVRGVIEKQFSTLPVEARFHSHMRPKLAAMSVPCVVPLVARCLIDDSIRMPPF